jgi:hypothetical protein
MKSVKKVVKAVTAQERIDAVKFAELAGARLSKAQILRMIGGVK